MKKLKINISLILKLLGSNNNILKIRLFQKRLYLYIIYIFISTPSFIFSQSFFPFIENNGQLPNDVVSKVKIPGGAVFIKKSSFRYVVYDTKKLENIHNLREDNSSIDAHSINVDFLKTNKNSKIILNDKSSYFENFYISNKSAKNVYFYKNLINKNLYDGIDMNMYVSENNLKYDLIVHPNIPTNQIKLAYKGQESLFLENGNLIIKTSVNNITELSPYAYQIVDNIKIPVNCHFKLKKNILSYVFPDGYNKNINLIIDPTLIFSTYSGSTADNFGYTATYDKNGFLYSGGTVFDVGYPTTIGAYQINYANNNGGTDIAITKYDSTGTFRIYSTYLGGSMDELPHSMIVNSYDQLFMFGTTGSDDYPTTTGCFQENFHGGNNFMPNGLGVSFPNGTDLVVSRFNANGGDLLASTYIGGSGNDGLNTSQKLKKNYADEVRGEIDIDKNNNIFIATCTYSNDFPITNSLQQTNNGGQEGCIIKIDNQLSTIIWSSYLGGYKDDAIYSLALDKNNNLLVTGGTTSSDFPTSINAYQSTYLDSIKADAFISHIKNDGTKIINSTYFGSDSYDQSYFVELNSVEEIYIFGQTNALGNTLIKNANYSTSGANQFIAILKNDLSDIIRSTVFGTGKGSPDISPTAFLVDVCNNIYLSGWGSSTGNGTLSTLNMPITNNAYQSTTDGNDFYIMVIDNMLNNLVYSTYFGGSQSAEHVDGGTSRFDKKGVIYQSVCAGCGNNNDFPIYPNPGAVSSTNNSNNCNNGVFKFDFDFPILISEFEAPWVSCNTNITFNNLTDDIGSTNYFWDFGDGNTSTQKNPTHQYLNSGIFNVMLISQSSSSCNFSDTIIKTIYILNNSSSSLQNIEVCKNQSTQIGILPINDNSITYQWYPSSGLSNPFISNPIATNSNSTIYHLIISNGRCADTLTQWIYVDSIDISLNSDTAFCKDPILLYANTEGLIDNIFWSSNNEFSDTISTTNNYIAENIGTYYVIAKNNLCFDMDSINVYNSNLNIEIVGIQEVCKGDSVFLKIDNLTSVNPIVSYNWSSSYPLFFENNDSSSCFSFPDSSTYYKVTAINDLGCFIIDSILVNVFYYPIYDSIWASNEIIFLGENSTLNILTEENILWSTQDTLYNILLYPDSSQYYHIVIYNESCQLKDSIYITVMDVFCDENKIIIPNAFSPNNDNKNDYYRVIDNHGIISKFKLEIFNRFGEKVFSSHNIEKVWDGRFKDKLLAPQIFDYYIEIECVGGKTMFHKGNITLIR